MRFRANFFDWAHYAAISTILAVSLWGATNATGIGIGIVQRSRAAKQAQLEGREVEPHPTAAPEQRQPSSHSSY